MVAAPDFAAEFNSIHAGHHPIEDCELGSVFLLQYFPGIQPIVHGRYLVVPLLEPALENASKEPVVFGNQDFVLGRAFPGEAWLRISDRYGPLYWNLIHGGPPPDAFRRTLSDRDTDRLFPAPVMRAYRLRRRDPDRDPFPRAGAPLGKFRSHPDNSTRLSGCGRRA